MCEGGSAKKKDVFAFLVLWECWCMYVCERLWDKRTTRISFGFGRRLFSGTKSVSSGMIRRVVYEFICNTEMFQLHIIITFVNFHRFYFNGSVVWIFKAMFCLVPQG